MNKKQKRQKKGILFFTVVLALVLEVVAVGWYLVQSTRGSQSTLEPKSPSVPIETRFLLEEKNIPPSLKNVPLYPRSKYIDSGAYSFDMYTVGNCNEGVLCHIYVYTFQTDDTDETIRAWYKKLKPGEWTYTDVDSINGAILSNGKRVFHIGITEAPHRIEFVEAKEPYVWPSATLEEKQSWNTYIDASGLFSIQYPREWTLKGNTIYIYGDPEGQHGGGVPSGITFEVRENKEHLSTEAFVRKYEMNNFFPTPDSVKNKPVFLNSLDTVLLDGMGGAGSPGPYVYVATKDKIIVLAPDGVELDDLSKMLSTFQVKN